MKRYSIVALVIAVCIVGAFISDTGKAAVSPSPVPSTAELALAALNAAMAAPTSGTLTQDYTRTPVYSYATTTQLSPYAEEGAGNYKRLLTTRTVTETRVWKTKIYIGYDYITYETVKPETAY